MSADLVTYNGYRFNEYSHITVNATMQPDEANRTILYNRYRIRVETTIYAEDGDTLGKAGEHFERIRDRLSKQGQHLQIHHEGFGVDFDINGNGAGGKRDLAFGPKPSVITWDAVGHINAVEVVWECEVCISACNRYSGLMSLNYGVTYRIDKAGYTTRTIAGHLEIAMSRVGRQLPDTADAYRDKVVVGHLPNYERETTWSLSLDKRRADFSIVDAQIRSPNEYPAGVIAIRANHSANWSRRQLSSLPQAIRASIELAQGQPRSRAIEIFMAIVYGRLAYSTGLTVFFEDFYIEEELFGNTFNISIGYRMLMESNESILTALSGLFASTGIGESLGLGTWQQWKASVAALQSHRGQSKLIHDHTQDQIIDMCSGAILESTSQSAIVPVSPPRRSAKLYNQKPAPRKSYLKFETWLETNESTPTTIQITVGPDDLKLAGNEFNPTNPEATLGQKDTSSRVERFVETQSGRIEVVWKGYAERVGYPIPRPDKLKIGNVTLKRIGKAQFVQKFMGNSLGQPVYAAAWNQRYVVTSRPEKMDGIDEWEGK